jgi:tetratricopeptide (TPR) repeat protein
MPARFLTCLTVALALSPAARAAEDDDERTQALIQRLFDRQAPLLAKGDFDGAEKLQKEAEAAIATLHDRDARELCTAIARVGRGAIAERRGYYGEAAAAFKDARDYFRNRGATPAEVAMAVNLGGMLTKQGDFKQAAAVLEEGRKALAGLGELGRAPVEAKLLGNLGAAYIELGEASKALPCLEASAELARKNGQIDAERSARANLAWFQLSQGRYAEAILTAGKLRDAFARAGRPEEEAAALNVIGLALSEQGRTAEALRTFAEARDTTADAKVPRGEATALVNLATVHFRLGNTAEAERYTRLAAAIYRDLGDKANTARVLLLDGRLHDEAGQLGTAEEAYREALRLAEAVGGKDQRAQALLALGMLMERRGKPDEAARSYATAADLFRETGDVFRADLVRLKAAFLRLADDKVLVNLDEVTTLEEHTRRLGDDRLTGHFYSARAIYQLEGKRWRQSEQVLRRAVAAEERFRGGDQDPLLKAAAGEYLTTPYAPLALALHEQGDAAGAFAASEAQKGRALTELLERGGSSSRKGLTEREAADERRLREAVASAAAQHRSGRGFAANDAAAQERYREELADAQARYDEMRRGLNLARPDYRVRHASFRPPDLERVQRTLFAREPDLAVLSYVVG